MARDGSGDWVERELNLLFERGRATMMKFARAPSREFTNSRALLTFATDLNARTDLGRPRVSNRQNRRLIRSIFENHGPIVTVSRRTSIE